MESNLEGLAGVLEADLPNYKSKILRILCTVYVLRRSGNLGCTFFVHKFSVSGSLEAMNSFSS